MDNSAIDWGKVAATRLAELLWVQHYKDKAPHWKPLHTTAEIISQIDNMIAGIIRERDTEYTRVNQWVSVETTPPPKDGTAFLGYFPFKRGYVADQSIVNIHWSGWGGGVWDNTTSGGHMSDSPTHWMPLPTPPGEGE